VIDVSDYVNLYSKTLIAARKLTSKRQKVGHQRCCAWV